MIVSLVVYFTLIPSFGLVGAAVGTVVTELTLFLLYFVYASRLFYRINLGQLMVKPLCSGALMIVGLLLLEEHLGIILALTLGLTLYSLSLLALGFFTEEEQKVLQAVRRLALGQGI